MSKVVPQNVMWFLEELGLYGDPAGYSEEDVLLAYERKCRAMQPAASQIGRVCHHRRSRSDRPSISENEHVREYFIFLTETRDEFLQWRGGRLLEPADEWCGVWGKGCDASEEQGRPSATPKRLSTAKDGPDGDDGSNVDAPCPKAPHCDTLHRKRYGSTKRNEYLFLFAAEQMCARCMRYYIEVEGVDPACQSAGKSARDYAMATARKSGLSLAVDVHAFLASHGV